MTVQFVQPGFVGDIRKVALAVTFVECQFRPDQQNVEIAVVVVIQKSTAVADGLKDIQRAFTRNFPMIVDPGCLTDFAKANWP
jgi:hypothetical protein